jgi:hypothetical protein
MTCYMEQAQTFQTAWIVLAQIYEVSMSDLLYERSTRIREAQKPCSLHCHFDSLYEVHHHPIYYNERSIRLNCPARKEIYDSSAVGISRARSSATPVEASTCPKSSIPNFACRRFQNKQIIYHIISLQPHLSVLTHQQSPLHPSSHGIGQPARPIRSFPEQQARHEQHTPRYLNDHSAYTERPDQFGSVRLVDLGSVLEDREEGGGEAEEKGEMA